MEIKSEIHPLSISTKFKTILSDEITKAGIDTNAIENYVIINFNDPVHSSDDEGYHPVEVMISPMGAILYITEFGYVNQELVKDLDFDFKLNLFHQRGQDCSMSDGVRLFRIFQSNFCDHYENGVFKVVATSF